MTRNEQLYTRPHFLNQWLEFDIGWFAGRIRAWAFILLAVTGMIAGTVGQWEHRDSAMVVDYE